MDEKTYAAWRDAKIGQLLSQERYDFQDLCDVIVILRGEGGCPWDREQDHHSIRNGLIEECYEVVEAIDREDAVLLREELGDVLLQLVFHADIEKDIGRFDIQDVANDECVKMIHRHPHVFGTVKADTSKEVLQNWEAIKTEEKQRVSLTDQLRAIPPMLPALMRAQKIGKKLKTDDEVELGDLCAQISQMLLSLSDAKEGERGEQVGEILFRMTALCRCMKVDAEEVLSACSDRKIQACENNSD